MSNSPDPRGPTRIITAVDDRSRNDITLVTLECGHVAHCANHFTYKVGKPLHCFDCGPRGMQAARDVAWISEYGLTQKLSNSIRCF